MANTLQWGWPKSDIHLLSVGTTYAPAGLLTHAVRGWGIRKWASDKKLLAISMSAQMRLSSEIAQRLLLPNHLTRVDPALSPQQAETIGLDVSSKAATDTLQALATGAIGQIDARTKKQFLGHTPTPP